MVWKQYCLWSMDYIGISQTIGRVIRKGDADKVFGLVCVPVYSNVGITTKKVEAVVDTIFNKGRSYYYYYTMINTSISSEFLHFLHLIQKN